MVHLPRVVRRTDSAASSQHNNDSQHGSRHSRHRSQSRHSHHHHRPHRARSPHTTTDHDPTTANNNDDHRLEDPVVSYHESARSIVFRDHLRRSVRDKRDGLEQSLSTKVLQLEEPILEDTHDDLPPLRGHDGVAGEMPIQPLAPLELGPDDVFEPLLRSEKDTMSFWTTAERDVYTRLQQQRALVKTIKNHADWTAFFERFQTPMARHQHHPPRPHDDRGPSDGFPYASFCTSTSLLPAGGRFMRCFGSETQYTTGVVFAWPDFEKDDDDADDDTEERRAQEETDTWAWPAGYAAKTEFNVDGRGRLINGRHDALVTVARLRSYNDDYATRESYTVAGRTVSRMKAVPYNEVYVRVGGVGRPSRSNDDDGNPPQRPSLRHGVGLPVALFCRRATFGHLIALLRKRARYGAVLLGHEAVRDLPLLLITPEHGVRVWTRQLQDEFWKLASRCLNPFQDPTLVRTTTAENVQTASLQLKVQELLDLEHPSVQSAQLTPTELARLAGGFGATDQSVAAILWKVVIDNNNHDIINNNANDNDNNNDKSDHRSENAQHDELHKEDPSSSTQTLQHVVTEGLTAAVRAGDYHTARQLLILYSTVAATRDHVQQEIATEQQQEEDGDDDLRRQQRDNGKRQHDVPIEKYLQMVTVGGGSSSSRDVTSQVPAPPPPPPLDTDRLRGATNSDGLLAVLGAAQILKALQDGTAKTRTEEAFLAVEEWVDYGENSMAFRISSWKDQRAAQGDLQIAMEQDSKFMAFVSTKAISNRRNFAKALRNAVESTSFTDGRFLLEISNMISHMSRPCLRLELLQYVLGLDNRFSIAHVARSVELAATCLGIRIAPGDTVIGRNRSALPVWLGVNP